MNFRTLSILFLVNHAAVGFAPQQSNTKPSVSKLFSTPDKSTSETQSKEAEAAASAETGNDAWIQTSLEKISPPIVGPNQVLIYDTTLRDGTQGESISASCDDKLKIAAKLVEFDVDYIEAGWPGSNPKDAEFFERAKTQLKGREKLVAFGSTRRKKMTAEEDPQLKALLESEAPTICLVAKSAKWQVEEILRATPDENIDMIRDTVEYLCSKGRQVMVDLEHFFDGFAEDEDYVLKCCEAAVGAGATCLVLCDTNGGTMPWEIHDVTKKIVQHFYGHVTVGIHAHNDCGMAVANSMMASKAGAGLVQGTMNGIGERTGNANLCSIIPSLALHVDSKLQCYDNLGKLTTLSRSVDELLNRTPDTTAPFVGQSAFAHKGGLHVAAMERNPMSYQHIDPQQVGNEQRTLISELAGRQNIMGKFKDIGVEHTNERALAILDRVKELESKGYTFEGAEASVHLMILHGTKGYCPPFQVLDYSAQVFDNNIDSATRVVEKMEKRKDSSSFGPTARATIKVRTVNLDEEVRDIYAFLCLSFYTDF